MFLHTLPNVNLILECDRVPFKGSKMTPEKQFLSTEKCHDLEAPNLKGPCANICAYAVSRGHPKLRPTAGAPGTQTKGCTEASHSSAPRAELPSKGNRAACEGQHTPLLYPFRGVTAKSRVLNHGDWSWVAAPQLNHC